MSVSKRLKHSKHFDSMRIPEFIHKVKQTIDENRGQSMRSIAKSCMCLKRQSEGVFMETFDTKTCVMKRGQFISENLKENCLNRSKRLLNKL